jgi:hypothetical protein
LLTKSSERSWLELGQAQTPNAMRAVCEEIFPVYQRNHDAWSSYFWDAKTPSDFQAALQQAKEKDVDQSIIRCMEQDLKFSRAGAGLDE